MRRHRREIMSNAATTSAAATKTNGDDQPPKPPALVLSSADFEAAAQMCEHEWMSHASGMSEVGKSEEKRGGEGEGEGEGNDSVAKKNQFDDDKTMVAPPKPAPDAPAEVVAPSSTLDSAAEDASASRETNGASTAALRGPGQQQLGGNEDELILGDRGVRQASSPSPLPSTPSTSDDDDEGLDLVPERGTFRSRRDATTRLPMMSPAISDGGGLRDEHVEDLWSGSDDDHHTDVVDSSESASASVSASASGGGAEADNERSASGGGTPNALRRRCRKLGEGVGGGGGGGGRGTAARRALLPPPAVAPGGRGNGDSGSSRGLQQPKPKRKKKKKKRQLERARSLRSPGRHFTVVTTASLPWMTGTSVNPTLRSAYLARALPRSSVTLMLPWLPASQQPCVFPKGISFETPQQQEKHVRDWIRQRTGFDPPGLRITWYHARYCPVMKSIFPYGGKQESFFSFRGLPFFRVFFFLSLSLSFSFPFLSSFS